ncbi:MAG TPA: monooxygenase [Alphaproteobacteria bacterium]|nr:monooxygenase [Alphaproteobacteria bacterium]
MPESLVPQPTAITPPAPAALQEPLPRVAIIGAGASGLAAAKALHQAGVPFTCFEASDQVGGNWVFKNRNGWSSAYRSLHINSSRTKMAYTDFPMPLGTPDFPHHSQVAAYLAAYVDHFGFREKIRFQTRVRRAEPELGQWMLHLASGEREVFDALIVANGHNWDPQWPDPKVPGNFDGLQMHSHTYVDPLEPVDCRDKRVLIVGFGDSALDIACELSQNGKARKVVLSQRRGRWVLPKYIDGRPWDQWTAHPANDAGLLRGLGPRGVRHGDAAKALQRLTGKAQSFGLLAPEAALFEQAYSVSHDLYLRIGSGTIAPKPGVRALAGRAVTFEDGSAEEVDLIIWCTGYRIRFPFFDESIISAPDQDIVLWHRIMDPRYLNLFFIGLVRPQCAMMPVAEQQANFVTAYLTGDYALPPLPYMKAERFAMADALKRKKTSGARSVIDIECPSYFRDLRQELARGRLRARTQGKPLPIKARAANASAVAKP